MLEPRYFDRSQRVSNDAIDSLREKVSELQVDVAIVKEASQHIHEAVERVDTSMRNMGNRLDKRMDSMQVQMDKNHKDLQGLGSRKDQQCKDHAGRLERLEHMLSKVKGGASVGWVALLVVATGLSTLLGMFAKYVWVLITR